MNQVTEPLVSTTAPTWATEFGEDEFGVWADCLFYEIVQRFRWLRPGQYMMGSPVTEEGRERLNWGKETRHKVIIADGFWLADTACTQKLWQAVMGSNPSTFAAGQNPVEGVNWHDIREFFSRLGEAAGEKVWRLPTEAEWEYAARAGSTTTFSFGPNINSSQVNYRSDAPYRDAQPEPGRGGTVPVKALAANSWGLYQMHGNVWEWCADAYKEDLGEQTAIDPYLGSNESSARVVRGGCWSCPAHGSRAAFRSYDNSTDRFNNLGFRIACGRPLPTNYD